MRAILGIDAAWTQREPTGVALIHGEGSTWSIASVAPSYESFVACGQGVPVDWRAAKFGGNWPKLPEVINAARQITTADLCVVAVDMPIATVPFESRRAADSAISRAFGGRGCSAHSPNATRPGALGAGLMGQLNADDFPLATTSHRSGDPPCTIEVYPHPALLALLSRDYRVPYKVSRSKKYWPDASISERIPRLLSEFGQIHSALEAVFGQLPFDLPPIDQIRTLSELKRYEDALDALVCAWVGLQFVQGAAAAYGDEVAAVWVPELANSK